METCTLDLPAMYGDHHVIEVRRILLETPGVKDVYASSGFQVVEITYEPTLLDAQTIIERLKQSGYLEEMSLPVESGLPATEQAAYFRHTAAYRQTGRVISFGQTVDFEGRALWPCPGLGPITEGE